MLKNKSYKYWVSWEESWYATRNTILTEGIQIMENSKFDQLQFTNDWRDVALSRQVKGHTNSAQFIEILPVHPNKNIAIKPFGTIKSYRTNWYSNLKHWPLFSSRPSINRASSALLVGYFNPNPSMWPVTFEFDWALKWFYHGNAKKGILESYGAMRDANHASTYAESNLKIINANPK